MKTFSIIYNLVFIPSLPSVFGSINVMTARDITCNFHHQEKVNGVPVKAQAAREVLEHAPEHITIQNLKMPFSK